MRIGFLSMGLGEGGAEAMMCRLSNLFAAEGNEVVIFVLNRMNATYILDKSVDVIDAGRGAKNKPQRIINSIMCITNYLRIKPIDVLLCFITTTIPIAVISRKLSKSTAKIIGAERTNPKAVKKYQRNIVDLFLGFCDGFIFQTYGARSCYPLKIQNRSIIIGNIIPHDIPYVLDETNTWDVCSIGRLHPDKDYDTVIKAWGLLHEKIPNAKIHIFGDGPERERLERLAQNLHIEKCVIFEGFRKDITQIIRKYGIMVFSSRAEGLPNALMEAMAMGMACVATNCEFGPSELIVNGENGYLVDVGDSKDMADKIEVLLKDIKIRKALGSNARKIREKYTPEVISTEYLGYFSTVQNS